MHILATGHPLLAAASLLVAACLVGAGCGAAQEPERAAPLVDSSPGSQATERTTTIYFLTDDGTAPLGVRRELDHARHVTVRLALEELLAGPTAAERRSGVTTAIPADAAMRSLTIERRGRGSDAFVDLSGLPAADDAGAVLKVRVMTQVARTLIGLSDIGRVWLRVDGRPWGLWDMRGNIRDDAIDYERLHGFVHICAAKPGTEAVPGDCFTALP